MLSYNLVNALVQLFMFKTFFRDFPVPSCCHRVFFTGLVSPDVPTILSPCLSISPSLPFFASAYSLNFHFQG